MITSLGKYLTGRRSEEQTDLKEALVRFSGLLLQMMSLHAVSVDAGELRRFRRDMDALAKRFEENSDPESLLHLAGEVGEAMRDFSQVTTKAMAAQATELRLVIGMLTDTLGAIAATDVESVEQLHRIEKQLEKTAAIDDIRTLKGKLGECLQSIRAESKKQKEQGSARLASIGDRLSASRERLNKLNYDNSIDPLTGLQLREAAENTIRRSFEERRPGFIGLFSVDRLQAVNARYGYAAGDQVLVMFSQHVAQRLKPQDLLFRWGAAFVCVIERDAPLEKVQNELRPIASARLEKMLELATRSVLVPISCRWTVHSVAQQRSADTVVDEIHKFLTANI